MAKKQASKTSKLKPKTKKKSSMAVPTSSMDKQWQIESDARTLKEAMAIKNDPNRMKSAKEYAMKEMEALKQVSKMKN